MTSKQIAIKIRREGQELKRRGEYLIGLAEELEAKSSDAGPSTKPYDQSRINEDLKAALAQVERKSKDAC